MNAQRQIEKLEKLAEAAYRMGCYACAKKWDLKREKLEAAISALETVKKESVKSMDKAEVISLLKKAYYDERAFKPEMCELIPALAALNPKNGDWAWLNQYEPVRKMQELGWRDRFINAAIEAAIVLSNSKSEDSGIDFLNVEEDIFGFGHKPSSYYPGSRRID